MAGHLAPTGHREVGANIRVSPCHFPSVSLETLVHRMVMCTAWEALPFAVKFSANTPTDSLEVGYPGDFKFSVKISHGKHPPTTPP